MTSPYRRSSYCCLCAVVAAAVSIAPAASAQSDADKLFEEGSAAFEAGDDQVALRKMRAAHEMQPDYRTAAGLGQVELHLARFRSAAEHLEYSLRHYPATGDPEGRELVMRGFAEARSHVATVTVEGQVAGAEFWVDGVLFRSLPVEHELFLEAGEHRYSFRKQGFEGTETEQYFPAGSQHTLRVQLRRVAEPAPGPAEPHHPVDPGAGPTIVVVGGLVTLVGLGLGAGFHYGAESAADDASALRARLRQNGASCESGSFVAGCANLGETLERASDRQTVSTVAFIGAAGAAAVTLVAYSIAVLAGEPDPVPRQEAGNVSFTHSLGRNFAWTGVEGRF